MRRFDLFFRCSLLLALSACSQDPTLVNPATFERPGDVAFVCYDSVTQGYVPLSACGPVGGVEPDERYSMTALVTQTASGEVGAIDLRLHRTLDSDVRVPGYTFVRVGEVPSAIIVPPEAPNVSYISNYGSRSVQWMDTARFRPDAVPMSGVEEGAIALPDGPVAMAMVSNDEGDPLSLFVALPRIGAVLPIPILPSGALEQPMDADLIDLLVPVLPDTLAAPLSEYSLACPDTGTRRADAELRDPVSLGMESEPVSLLVVDDELLVADAALPVIHRFAIGEDGSLTAMEPLPTGVPVRRIAVTPVVPAEADGMTGTARYLYAIDATDQSVLAMDFLEGSPTFGGIIPVRTGPGRNDRIDLSADARSLGILTPDYPGGSVCTTNDGTQDPDELRGVFLAVGQTNGGMTIVDILDLDATCRITNDECEGEETYVERHRPRIGTVISTDENRLSGTPSFTLNGTPRLTDLSATTCPEFMEAAGANICVSSDPYSATTETWTATFQGAFLSGGRGQFEGNVFTMSAFGGGFCRGGVIGRDDIVASNLVDELDPEAGYGGDDLVITSPPSASRVEANPECERYVDPEDGRDFNPIRFQIISATEDGLELAAVLRPAAGFGLDNTGGTLDYDRVFRCYEGSAFRYEVRAREAYLVEGRDSGFEHRVIDTPMGCRIDTEGQPVVSGDASTYRNHIALPGRRYMNPNVAFTIGGDTPSFSDESVLSFTVTGAPLPLVVDVGSRGTSARRPALVAQVIYNPVTSKLYALDSNSDGFVEYALDPLTTEFVFE